jgi:hypothetical protein
MASPYGLPKDSLWLAFIEKSSVRDEVSFMSMAKKSTRQSSERSTSIWLQPVFQNIHGRSTMAFERDTASLDEAETIPQLFFEEMSVRSADGITGVDRETTCSRC